MKYALLTALILSLPTLATQPEKQLLNNYSSAFRPDSTTLCLVTETGDTLSFCDCTDLDDFQKYAKFILIDYLTEQNLWVLRINEYEWLGWQLVSENTGTVQQIVGPPVPSPDGTRLLCMMDDLDAGFIDNGIQIWKLSNNKLTLEFEDIAVPWGPINGEWRGNDRIIFDKLTHDYELYEYITEPGMLTMDENGNWTPGDTDDWE